MLREMLKIDRTFRSKIIPANEDLKKSVSNWYRRGINPLKPPSTIEQKHASVIICLKALTT